jgi:hypothetical protein
LGKTYPKISINNDVIRNRPGAISFEDGSVRIRYDGIGKLMVGDPGRDPSFLFQDSYGDDLKPLFPKSLPKFLLYSRSLPLAPCSKGFPENKKYWRPLQV